MNANDQTNVPPPLPSLPAKPTPLFPPRPFSWWLRKFFACNPFYLMSAALLLYGCYRVSIDAPMFNRETARLLFNFSSVQLYEVLLVATAIFLARRAIWHDSTLLVVLENLLVFVPFILISLAALIDSGMAMIMCFGGALVATARFGLLKRFFTQLNLPGRVLEIGALLLALNGALPLIYRHFGQTKVGIHIESGAAYFMNEFTWLLILPAVLALANFLPQVGAGGDLPPQHRRLPSGVFTLWLTVTGVHVYALDYIYQFEFRPELFAPCTWVVAWTACGKFSENKILPRHALLIAPALAPLIALTPDGNKTFLVITGLNITAFLVACGRDRQNHLARQLLFGSVLLFAAGMPEAWRLAVAPGLQRTHWIAAGLAGYLLYHAACSRNPKFAILGAFISSCAALALLGNYAGALHWAMQTGLVFFVLHSLRWHDAEHAGSKLVRTVVCAGWALHAFIWMKTGMGAGWMPLVPASVVLGIVAARKYFFGQRVEHVVAIAAGVVMLAGPVNTLAVNARTMPAGLIAVISSFALFALGTVLALTRHRWHSHLRNEPKTPLSSGASPNPNETPPAR